MIAASIVFLLALAVALLATRVAIRVAWRLRFLDEPDGYRKTHAVATPRLGGVAVYLGFLAPIAVLLACPHVTAAAKELAFRQFQIGGLVVGATLALAMGMADDIFNLRPRWKLLGQLVIGTVMFFWGFRIQEITNPLGGSLHPGLFDLPITLFWFMGCMNAVNLLDGLDGLAAGTCLFVGMPLFLVSLQFNNVLGMVLMAAMIGSALGFLLYNFPPARIFLGDSGSMLLGFLVAALSLLGTQRKAQAAVALFVPVIALGLPIFDTSVAMLRRWYKRLPITAPDRQHIHHVLVAMGYSQQRAVLILYGICVALGGAALVVTFVRGEVILLVIGSLVITAFVCVRVFSGVRLMDVVDKLSRDAARRTLTNEARMAVEQAVADMRQAADMASLWDACTRVFRRLGIHASALSLTGSAKAALGDRTWAADPGRLAGSEGRSDFWSARLSLRLNGQPAGELIVERRIGHRFSGSEMPEQLDRLRNELATQMERILNAPPPPGAAGAART